MSDHKSQESFVQKKQWNVLKPAAILAIPVEIVASVVLSSLPLDIEPTVKPNGPTLWAGLVTEIIHFPAFPVLETRLVAYPMLIRLLFFIVGYVDLVIMYAAGVSLCRLVVKLVKRSW